MPDIASIWNADRSIGDWAVTPASAIAWLDENGNAIVDQNNVPVSAQFYAGGILSSDDDLFTAALISVFTDAQADDDDILPAGETDRRGWWGGPIGSKLWLRRRARADNNTLLLVKHDLEQATNWFIDDGVVASIDVTTEWIAPGQLGAQIAFHRKDGTRRALSFQQAWESQ